MDYEINEAKAKACLALFDQGLVSGLGKPIPGQMCIEAAVNYAFGWEHGDEPKCVSPVLRAFKIVLNDAEWSSDLARAKGMRRLGLAQLGSEGMDGKELAKELAMAAVNFTLPLILEARWPELAKQCKEAKSLIAASTAAATAAKAAAKAAADAATDAAKAASTDAAKAASTAAHAATTAAYAATIDAAYAAAKAARAATDAATTEASLLPTIAEHTVQILIRLNYPGCQWLYLTE